MHPGIYCRIWGSKSGMWASDLGLRTTSIPGDFESSQCRRGSMKHKRMKLRPTKRSTIISSEDQPAKHVPTDVHVHVSVMLHKACLSE